MNPASLDAQLRQAAFDQVNRLATLRDGTLDADDLSAGFQFQGERIPLVNRKHAVSTAGCAISAA